MEINIEELHHANEVKITVVGVGGGGCNTVNHIIQHGVDGDIKLVSMNTEAKALKSVTAHSKIQLGENTTRGFGAGMDPKVGRASAEESHDIILEELKDSHIVLVTTGLGGGTGTGAAPVIAKIAREEVKALTIAVITKPFGYEGAMRAKVAEEGLKDIREAVDVFIMIPNEKLGSVVDKGLGFKDSFKIVNDVTAQAIKGIASFILNGNGEGISIDFADLNTIMKFKGLGLIGIGEKDGEDSAVEAVKEALESPLLDNVSINGAKGAIVYYEINEKYPFHKLQEANYIVQQQVDKDAFLKIGHMWNNELSPTQIKVTLVITGFEKGIVQTNAENKEEAKEAENAKIPNIRRLKLAVGGGTRNSGADYSEIDTPIFLREQQD